MEIRRGSGNGDKKWEWIHEVGIGIRGGRGD